MVDVHTLANGRELLLDRCHPKSQNIILYQQVKATIWQLLPTSWLHPNHRSIRLEDERLSAKASFTTILSQAA
jgi:hypothetical protein